MYPCPSFDISMMPLILQVVAWLHCSAVVASTSTAGTVAHDPVKRQTPSAKVEHRKIFIMVLGSTELASLGWRLEQRGCVRLFSSSCFWSFQLLETCFQSFSFSES